MRRTISMLPDEVLLAIFDFHVAKYQDLDFIEALLSDYDTETKIRSWQSLVHVCRPCPWITTSPETATLLYNQNPCEGDPGHLARLASSHSGRCLRNVIEELWTAMQVPFLELAVLYLSYDYPPYAARPVLHAHDSFLGGSAPRLRYLALNSIPFRVTRLVRLWLVNIPHSGYISPEAMVTLTSLEELFSP